VSLLAFSPFHSSISFYCTSCTLLIFQRIQLCPPAMSRRPRVPATFPEELRTWLISYLANQALVACFCIHMAVSLLILNRPLIDWPWRSELTRYASPFGSRLWTNLSSYDVSKLAIPLFLGRRTAWVLFTIHLDEDTPEDEVKKLRDTEVNPYSRSVIMSTMHNNP